MSFKLPVAFVPRLPFRERVTLRIRLHNLISTSLEVCESPCSCLRHGLPLLSGRSQGDAWSFQATLPLLVRRAAARMVYLWASRLRSLELSRSGRCLCHMALVFTATRWVPTCSWRRLPS